MLNIFQDQKNEQNQLNDITFCQRCWGGSGFTMSRTFLGIPVCSCATFCAMVCLAGATLTESESGLKKTIRSWFLSNWWGPESVWFDIWLTQFALDFLCPGLAADTMKKALSMSGVPIDDRNLCPKCDWKSYMSTTDNVTIASSNGTTTQTSHWVEAMKSWRMN